MKAQHPRSARRKPRQAKEERAKVLLPKLIPMHLIDEPDIAMRSKMDDEKLSSLAADIGRIGLTNAICVRSRNGRFGIIAGHRRFVAHKMLGRAEIEAKDYTGSPLSDEAIKFSENFQREDVNDADMADYLADLQEKQNLGVEELCAITGQSEDWISKRLSLYRGDERIYESLRAGRINLGHAIELNRLPERYIEQYLLIVEDSTPPIKEVQKWVREFRKMGLPTEPLAEGQQPAEQAQTMPGVTVDPCRLCNGTQSPWDMEFIKVHKGCLHSIVKAIQDGQA